MYWTNFRQPIAHVQPNIFGQNLLEVCSLHFYASFGTFCVQIGQLLETQWVFEHSQEVEIDVILPFSYIFQRLTVPRMINQFGRKKYQKKRKYVSYQLL